MKIFVSEYFADDNNNIGIPNSQCYGEKTWKYTGCLKSTGPPPYILNG